MVRCTCLRLSSSLAAMAVIAVAITVTLLLLRDHQAEASQETPGRFPILINTWAFAKAATDGWTTLLQNGSALDAIVSACSRCQTDQCDHTVGWGGSPDENGETTLDAMIMDGPSHTVGSVAALRNVKNVIAVARAVMDYTEHTLLVGDQATAFATMMGFTKENLTSNWSANAHQEWLTNKCQPNFWTNNVTPNPANSCGPYKPVIAKTPKPALRRKAHSIDRYHHDTIGIVTIDGDGRIASGTSTNGARNKIPGRVGDSPIAGAGSYVDQDVGGAAATGDGDIIMRFLVSYQTVENMRQGMNPEKAAQEALKRILPKFPKAQIGVVAVNIKTGVYSAACIGITGGFPFMVATVQEAPEGVQHKQVKCINV